MFLISILLIISFFCIYCLTYNFICFCVELHKNKLKEYVELHKKAIETERLVKEYQEIALECSVKLLPYASIGEVGWVRQRLRDISRGSHGEEEKND